MSTTKAAIRIEKHIRAPRERVYRALIEAHAVAIWMVPDDMSSEIHTFDPREGGAFRISLTYYADTALGKTGAGVDTFHGRFVSLVPGSEVVEVIEFESDDMQMRGEMTVTFKLVDADGGTDLSAVHENLPPGLSAADNETGWRMSLDKLASFIEGPHDNNDDQLEPGRDEALPV